MASELADHCWTWREFLTAHAYITSYWGHYLMLGVTVACLWFVARVVGVTRRARRGMTIAADRHGLAWTEIATGKRPRDVQRGALLP